MSTNYHKHTTLKHSRLVGAIALLLAVFCFTGAVVTADDVENHKPAPDTFLKAAALLGVPAEECRAYEDTDIGLQAIRAAGMEPVDVREIPGVLHP